MEEKCEELLEIKKKDKFKTAIIKLFKENYRMKLLVVFLIFNIVYLTFGSFVFITHKVFPEFNYEQFSLGLRNMFFLNVTVFLIICFSKKYKKDWSHLILDVVFVTRCNCNYIGGR
jgi:hypothetical protein